MREDRTLPPIYANTRQVSRLFGIPEATLTTRRTRYPDAPPFRKVGTRVLYRVDEVEQWIETTGRRSA